MKMRAYPEIYLNHAQAALGDAFDYAVNDCHLDGGTFVNYFTASPICRRIENGEPLYLTGKSGIEIARDVIFSITRNEADAEPGERMYRSHEYWIGWAVCYYQWYSDRRFIDIFKALPFDDLYAMYSTLHEADITKFVEIAQQRMNEFFSETNLKRFRSIHGCTQAELAEQSGVSVRSIQMYEQRNKDINKASAETIYRLAKVLGCGMEDLIEKG